MDGFVKLRKGRRMGDGGSPAPERRLEFTLRIAAPAVRGRERAARSGLKPFLAQPGSDSTLPRSPDSKKRSTSQSSESPLSSVPMPMTSSAASTSGSPGGFSSDLGQLEKPKRHCPSPRLLPQAQQAKPMPSNHESDSMRPVRQTGCHLRTAGLIERSGRCSALS